MVDRPHGRPRETLELQAEKQEDDLLWKLLEVPAEERAALATQLRAIRDAPEAEGDTSG